ncbi:methionyl-tRNA formyltransferase [Anaerococcus sp.]|uniref:methionyl-tRNA formyltransferase n=1 Tax=Anaerococcus TaxID=165779 RepID=UPI0029038A05|nr:methionyl-tRNA formyltransferase [Anaerococcus sp.]MDU1865042.1 methionyl-tRNA formyltransferase [Anaerococcus sp.]MDU2565970.1 methionyl-tRNA formyltransferase [Anaerococcus sp.]
MKSKTLNICFMGNPKFAVQTLDVLCKDSNFDVKLVVSSKDKKRSRNKVTPTEVKKYAMENNVPVSTPDSVNTEEFVKELKDLEIDFIVVVAFGQLIGNLLLEEFHDRIINLHPSILPKYRGAAPMQFTLLNGDKETAPTTMLIEKGMDSGDILLQNVVNVDINDDYYSLENKMSNLGSKAIKYTLLNFDKLYVNRIKQDDSKATFTKKISKEMGNINWENDSFAIYNQIRALIDYPKAYFHYEGKNVKVLESEILDSYQGNPGYVYEADSKNNIIIGTKNGAIRINKLQFPGKKAMDTKSFLMGNDFKKGIYLDD